jgi:hypothetical protein
MCERARSVFLAHLKFVRDPLGGGDGGHAPWLGDTDETDPGSTEAVLVKELRNLDTRREQERGRGG